MSTKKIRVDRPIDPVTEAILVEMDTVAKTNNIQHLLVGATARDILLTHVYGLEVSRATKDVDFAVAVKDWDQFETLCSGLVARKTFKKDHKAMQRLFYQGQDSQFDYLIDLVPFGDLTQGSTEIAWPPDMQSIMSVAGFEEALATAELVEITPALTQKVVSIAGLAILKIIAWSDRGIANPKDAQDLAIIMQGYTNAGNFDRVFDIDGVIEMADYDPDMAGIYLLGLDIRQIASVQTLAKLKDILAQHFERLLEDIIRAKRHYDNVEQHGREQLRLLMQGMGFIEIVPH